jgi:hypothetical protein
MKRRVEAKYPKTLGDLIRVLLEVWEDLSLATINELIAQMPNRLIQVIARNGQMIEYP